MAKPIATDSLDRESTLLPEDPPSWLVRGVAWLLVALFALVLLAAVAIKVPETVRCAALVVPDGGADPIQAPRAAVVQQVRVREGSVVATGAELFVLSSEDAGDRNAQARGLEEDLATRRRDLKRAEATDAADLQIKDHEIAQADEELKFREATLAVERDLDGRIRKLAALGINSQTDVILRDLEVTGAEKDLSVITRTRQQVVLQRQQMTAEQERARSDGEAEVRKLEVRLESLRQLLDGSDHNLLTVRAPYDAVVVSMAANNPGSVVQVGQELCQLARTNGTLRLRLVLSESGLSRLAVGQTVRFFADAFPYQRYGTLVGKLTWISPSAILSHDTQQFVAEAALDRDSYQFAGRPHPLQVGMGGEARVEVGSRTPIEFVLEPIRQLRENLGRSPP